MFSNHSAVKWEQIIFILNSITQTRFRNGHLVHWQLLVVRAHRTTGLVQIARNIYIIMTITKRNQLQPRRITKFSCNSCKPEIMNSYYTNTRLRHEKWFVRATSTRLLNKMSSVYLIRLQTGHQKNRYIARIDKINCITPKYEKLLKNHLLEVEKICGNILLI